MAYVPVQTSKQFPTAATRNTGVTSLAETFASTPTVGNVVFVFISHFNAASDKLTTVTDNQSPHNTWTILSARPRNALGGGAVAIAYSIITQASGTFTITANFSASSDPVIGISEFSGNGAVSIEDGSNSGTGNSTAPAGGSVTPTQAGDLFLSAICDSDSTQTYTIPSGWDGKLAENADGSTGMVLGSASFITPDASARSSTWAVTTSTQWAALVAAFKPATGVSIGFGRSQGPQMRGPKTPVSRFRSPAAFVVPDPVPPPTFWRLRGPQKGFGDGGPWSRFPTRPLPYLPAGGPATYDDTVAESGSATDAVDTTMVMANTLTESAAAADALTGALLQQGSVSESLAAADALSAQQVFANALSEAGAAADALSSTQVFASTLAEAAAAADALSAGLLFANALAEAVAAADAQSSTAVWANPLSEPVSALDALSVVGGTAVADKPVVARGGGIPPYWLFHGHAPIRQPPLPLYEDPPYVPPAGVTYDEAMREAVVARDRFGRVRLSMISGLHEVAGAADALAAENRIAAGMTEGIMASVLAGQGAVAIKRELLARLLLGEALEKAHRIAPLDRDRPIVNMMRVQLRHLAAAFLRDLGHRVAAAARNVGKAAGDDPPRGAAAEADDADYEGFGDAAKERIREVAKDGAHRGLEQVRANVERLLAQTNKRAVAWADRRAAELVTSVSQTTRDRVRDLVRQAEEEGWSNDELADAIAEDGVFGDARAETIARTETADADVAGNLEGWKESGVVSGKEWTVAQDSACDICEEFDGMIVGLDEEFPEGDPPAHPNCRCDVLPVLADESDEE